MEITASSAPLSRVALFDEDFDKYPNICVHNETKNESFKEYAALLKSMGIKNYRWPLQLHNPLLAHIDPLDPSLGREHMLMVKIECIINPFYYFREVAKAPGHSPERPKLFLANRGNMSMFWLYFNSITTYLIQIRQTGKSLSMDHLAGYLTNIHYTKKTVNLLTKDDGLRKQNMDRMREINSLLPFYLNGHKKGDINNTEQIYYGIPVNKYVGHVPSTSDKQANGVGRGWTAPTYLIDEAAFIRYAEISIPAMLAGGNDARTQAKNDGDFYGTVVATTAGKKDDVDGQFIYRLINEAAIWSESYLDAHDRQDLYRIVSAASPKGVPEVHCAFNHRQLGKTDSWLKAAMIAAKSTGDAADRDYGNVWTDGSQRSPLSTKDTARIRASQMASYDETQRPWPFTLRWYMPKDAIEQYMANNKTVMAFDASEAIGRDDSTLVFRDVRDGRVVAAANVNDTNTIEIAKWLAHLLIKYENTTWIPENKLNGSTIIDYVLLELVAHGQDPFRRIFNLVVQEHLEFKERYKTIVSNGRIPKEYVNQYRRFFGFKTAGGGIFSRDGLYGSVFMAAVKYTGDKVHDTVLINQMLALVTKNDRIDHPVGGKDDMVVSWLLSYWFLSNGLNMSHYGINSRDVLADNEIKEEEETVDKQYNRMLQQRLRDQATLLIERLQDERDPFIVSRLENRLKHVESQMSDEDKLILSADDLIAQIRQERGARRRRG